MSSIISFKQKCVELEKQKLAIDEQIYNVAREELETVLNEIKKLRYNLKIVEDDIRSFDEKTEPFIDEIYKLWEEINKLVKLKDSHENYMKKFMKIIPNVCNKEFENILMAIVKTQTEKEQLIAEQKMKINELKNDDYKQLRNELTKLSEMLKLKVHLEQEILETSKKVDPEVYKKQIAKKYLGLHAEMVADFEFDGDDDAKTYFSEGYHDIELFTMEYKLKSTDKKISIYMKSGGTKYHDFWYNEVLISCGDYHKQIDGNSVYIDLNLQDFKECPEILPFFKAYGKEDGVNNWIIENLEVKRVIAGEHN